MPKMKNHKSATKRYRVTGTGKVTRKQAGRGHLNQKKTSRRKRNLDHKVLVHSANLERVCAELPYPQYCR
ncbi:MAG: 50S ribosomal protein L35 [Vampirovibrionales bacterium]|nr:50S ribosomal protein L35 [Vampirovibrionales bacterium]